MTSVTREEPFISVSYLFWLLSVFESCFRISMLC